MSQYSAQLDQQDQQRLAHHNMIAARGDAMHGVNAGNFEVLASALTVQYSPARSLISATVLRVASCLAHVSSQHYDCE